MLSVFENAGLGIARLQTVGAFATRTPHVMVTCWLAEDCQAMPPRRRRSIARSLRSVTRLVVFSTNQQAVLEEYFGVGSRVRTVPFGVDTEYYDRRLMHSPGGGAGLVAVGSDSRRDYATLFEAVRIANVPLRLACQPRNVTGLRVPPQVTLLGAVYGEDYRDLLHRADVVVTPTVAPAYPSGQSVVLEAMAMAKATVTTDSSAMRDYVRDGVNGALVEGSKPEAMAARMTELLEDSDAATGLGDAAAVDVRRRFTLGHMWDAIADVVSEASTTGEAGTPAE